MDPSAVDVRALARRVVGRVLAERGLGGAPGALPAGVHVDRPGGEPRPAERAPSGGRAGRGPDLVTARCLAGTPDGGRFVVARGARVTPLAHEEAHRRGVRLVAGDAAGERAAGPLVVALGADHGGVALRRSVLAWLRELGHRAQDHGTRDDGPVDYPDLAHAVARAVADGDADLGICIDGAGIGSAMVANKVPGVRAALCYDEATARNAREHNHANVLTLGAGRQSEAVQHAIVRAFLATPPGGGRHARRVGLIDDVERRYRR